LIEVRFYVPPDIKPVIWRRSSQPISWFSTEKDIRRKATA